MEDSVLKDHGSKERFRIIKALVDSRTPLFLLGPAGSGKSYLGTMIMQDYALEKLDGAKVYRLGELDDAALQSGEIRALYIAGSANVTRLDVLGGRTLDEGSYTRRPGILQKMQETGGIVFLDELSSLPPQFSILLNEVIDRIINRDAHENFYMFFAGNPGTYLGANEIPDSTAERLITLWFDYYPFEDEVEIVKQMLRNSMSLASEVFNPIEGFNAFIRFCTGLVRKMRRTVSSEQEVPLSVRSIFMLAATTLALASISPSASSDDTLGSSERIGIHKKIADKLPETMSEGVASDSVDTLTHYMQVHGISWSTIRKAIDSLGSIQRTRGSSVHEAFMSVVPT